MLLEYYNSAGILALSWFSSVKIWASCHCRYSFYSTTLC